MKILYFLLLTEFSLAEEGESPQFKIAYEDAEFSNYSTQLRSGLGELLKKNPKIAEKFREMENAPVDDSRGRYSGEPTVQVLVLAASENVDFQKDSGDRVFEKTIALYYRFDEGMHRGSQSHSGFFAIFVVEGKLAFEIFNDDQLKIKNSEVVATFRGFKRSIDFPVDP